MSDFIFFDIVAGIIVFVFFFQAEDGIRDGHVTGVQTCALPIFGGLRLLGFRREMGPDEAARAAELLGAQHLIPVAYGAWTPFPWWWYARDPARRFVAACKARGIASDRVVVLEPGESWHLYK